MYETWIALVLVIVCTLYFYLGMKWQELGQPTSSTPVTKASYAFLKQDEEEDDSKDTMLSLKTRIKEFEYKEKNFIKEIQQLRQKVQELSERSLEGAKETNTTDLLNNGLIDVQSE